MMDTQNLRARTLAIAGICLSSLVLGANASAATVEENYETRCASCHDNPPDEKTPHLSAIETMGKTRISFALNDGRMAIYTQGMSDDEIEELVEFINKLDEQSIDSTKLCSDRPISPDIVVSHWGVDSQNTRYQSNSSISSTNIDQLELKFAFGVPNSREMRSWPAVSADTIFMPTTTGMMYAIDRDVGCVKWTHNFNLPLRTSAHLINAESGLMVAVGDFRSNVHLLDATNGELIWTQNVAGNPNNMNTGAPVFYKEDWLIPVSAFEIAVAMNPRHECCKSHGMVRRLKGDSGEIMWTAHMTEPAEPTYKNDLGVQMHGPSGAPVWTTPAVDEKRGVLYVGTGENTSSPATDMSDAIVAIDLESGEIKAFFQGWKDDAFNMACGSRRPQNCPKEEGPDFDFGASPVLVTTAKGRDLVVAGQKSGDVWALDPDDDLKLVWNNKLSNGSALGGVHWGLTIVGNMVFVPIADPEFITKDPNPGVFAINLDTGETVWEHKAERGCRMDGQTRRVPWPDCPFQFGYSAAASSTNDLVFAGSLNGTLKAFRANDGEVVWSYDTKKPFTTANGIDGHGGAIDNPGAVIAGDQLIVMSGYGQFGQMPGNVMLVFEL